MDFLVDNQLSCHAVKAAHFLQLSVNQARGDVKGLDERLHGVAQVVDNLVQEATITLLFLLAARHAPEHPDAQVAGLVASPLKQSEFLLLLLDVYLFFVIAGLVLVPLDGLRAAQLGRPRRFLALLGGLPRELRLLAAVRARDGHQFFANGLLADSDEAYTALVVVLQALKRGLACYFWCLVGFLGG